MQREVSKTTTISTVETGGKLARLASTSGGRNIKIKVMFIMVTVVVMRVKLMTIY